MATLLRALGITSAPAEDTDIDEHLIVKPKQTKRHMLHQLISLAMIVTSALMIWKGLVLATGSESPIVVVLSGSMEPGFKRGDILFLNRPAQVRHCPSAFPSVTGWLFTSGSIFCLSLSILSLSLSILCLSRVCLLASLPCSLWPREISWSTIRARLMISPSSIELSRCIIIRRLTSRMSTS